jgi:tetratricopeptide (TPR) repeat protein
MNTLSIKLKKICAGIVGLGLLSSTAWADLETNVLALQKQWAEVNYQIEGKDQISAFERLIIDADAVVGANPKQAAPLIWRGIIKSTLAGKKGGLGALGLAKAAKKDLEKSLTLDATAMLGSALTSLGTLYLNVPGWPVGFGSDKKAEKFLLKAIAINPDGIDSNYFYADFLMAKKRNQEAATYFRKAQNAAPRFNRPLADSGRQKEIATALESIN